MNQQASFSDSKKFNNQLIERTSTEKLFLQLDKMLDKEEREELIKSTHKILKQCIPSDNNTNYKDDNTGLVIGYVQSGKTMSFTSVIALAQDNGYRIIIIISGRTQLLLRQTTKRLKKDFKNNSDIKIIESKPKSNALQINKINKRLKKGSKKTIIITTLKHQGWIHGIRKKFNEENIQNELNKNTVLIIDDEADQASLNTKAKLNAKTGLTNESAIYGSIIRLRNTFPRHSYIQYTATPQAPLLIDYLSALSPDWAVVLTPGKKYTGGKIFFKENSKYIQHIKCEGIDMKYPPDSKALTNAPRSLIDSIIEFLIISSLICYSHENKKAINDRSSMMIHPTYKVKDEGIDQWFNWTKNIIEDIESDLENNFHDEIKDIYIKIKKSLEDKYEYLPDFNNIIELLKELINDELEIWKVVGQNNKTNLNENGEIPWEDNKHHILVGGQLLDRGFTVEDLVITYMPRDTKGKNQADTIEQRCRFFGYKKAYLDFCKVYLPRDLISDYKNYVEHEENIHNFLKDKPLHDFKQIGSRMLLDSNLVPTNMSRISDSVITHSMTGFQYYEPTFPREEKNNKLIESFIKEINEKHEAIILEPSIEKHKLISRKHNAYHINSDSILQLLRTFDIYNPKESLKKANMITYLENVILKEEKIWLILIAPENEQKRERTIKIKINNDKSGNNIYSISQLTFGGMWKNEEKTIRYFGDRELLKNDTNPKIDYNKNELIIQIHEIKVKSEETKEEVNNTIHNLNSSIQSINKLEENSNEREINRLKGIIDELERFKKELDNKTFFTLALNFPDKYRARYIQLNTK